jgi:hypothetical protein
MSDDLICYIYKLIGWAKFSRRSPITVALFLSFAFAGTIGSAADCDEFVSWVAPAKNAYQKTHRIHPVPEIYKDLAVRYMPRIWVHPESWQPIDFDDYLANSRLVRTSDRKLLIAAPSVREMIALDYEEQCAAHLETDEVPSRNPAPIYIQVFRDQNPADQTDQWIYIKYNLVFDWSGLAVKISWLSRLGAWLSGGDLSRWHRLDIHIAAILAFDADRQLRMLTLAQHNHQQTFLAGIDFPKNQKPLLVAAARSNELYLDNGSTSPAAHRVVPFFTDVAYLIDSNEKPMFWATDITYGRNAGGKEIQLNPVFLEPGHPLADFAGLLAPPRRLLGIYIGRDGPPGYNYYALPAYTPLIDFAAMGFWQAGDTQLMQQIKSFIADKNDMHATDWNAMTIFMRKRLATAISNQGVGS